MTPALSACLRAALYDWECEEVAGRRQQDVDFYLGLAAAATGPGGVVHVLELACGTGRVTVPLARRAPQARVVGLDLDRAMLAGARRRASGSPGCERVALVQGDMRRFALARAFDLVAIPYNSLQLVGDEQEAADCVAGAGAHLRPGGVLALEVTGYGEAGAVPGQGAVSGVPLGTGAVAGFSVELAGGFGHDPAAGVTRYHRRWTLRRPGQAPLVVEDTVALRALDRTALDGMVLAAGLEPWRTEREGRVLRYAARRPRSGAAR